MASKTTPAGTPLDKRPMQSLKPEGEYNRTDDEKFARTDWEWLLDNGLIPVRNPQPSPEFTAAREANDRLFRSFPHNRPGVW